MQPIQGLGAPSPSPPENTSLGSSEPTPNIYQSNQLLPPLATPIRSQPAPILQTTAPSAFSLSGLETSTKHKKTQEPPTTELSPLPPKFSLPRELLNKNKSSSRRPPAKDPRTIAPDDTRPRISSPLVSIPTVFGGVANVFGQAAALAEEPPSPKSVLSASDRDSAAEMLCQIAFLQPEGLMANYLEFMLPGILKPMSQQHEREKPMLEASEYHWPIKNLKSHSTLANHYIAGAARAHLLSKKYFARWKANTYRRALNRRARDRRQKRLEAINKESQKRIRDEAELEAILQAKKEKERIQAEMSARSSKESSPQHATPKVPQVSGVQQSAGNKRKSMHVDRVEDATNGDAPRKMVKAHKRSRTMGHAGGFPVNQLSHSAPSHFSTSIFSGRSILSPSRSQDLRRSLSGRKDTTRTDYFRLKALGIDPDTPVIPDTKASLERKRKCEEEAAEASRSRARALSSGARPPVPAFSPLQPTTNAIAAPTHSRQTPQSAVQRALSTTPAKVNDDDDFLRQIREVRATMSADTAWFKQQATQIEKEVEQQEELRRSASRASSRDSPAPSTTVLRSGFACVNGYEYLPNRSINGQSLSRTEQRIRRTGARGLATKPIGGTKDYLAVAMSKRSARALSGSQQPESDSEAPPAVAKKQKGKRKMGEKDTRYRPEESDEESEELGEEVDTSRHHATNAIQNGTKHTPATAAAYQYSTPAQIAEEEYDDEESEGDPEDYVQQSLEYPDQEAYDAYDHVNGVEGGDTDEFYEGGDDEGEDGEDEEDLGEETEDEVGDLPEHQTSEQGRYWLRSSATPEPADRLTPNTGGREMSRASSGMESGTGATAEDAFVLDSD